MPVRIYDIAKKLGIESKDVLVKARELGMAGAKVPSSSLDKITAEYLEEQLGGKRVTAPQLPPAVPEPIVIVSAPPESPPAPEPVSPPAEIVEANALTAEPPPLPPQP